MKRVILTIVGTVLGLVALLSFRSHGQPAAANSGLPSAALPGSSSSTEPPAASSTTTTTGAPPDPSATPTTSSASAAAKSYLGQAVTTRYGVVQVKITVVGNKITNVSFVQLTADDGRSQRINSDAAPTLLQETLAAQSANIDSVSGASYTSQGYEQSLQSALDQAGLK
jgi:uncharacterized protein with FMN-binding domain